MAWDEISRSWAARPNLPSLLGASGHAPPAAETCGHHRALRPGAGIGARGGPGLSQPALKGTVSAALDAGNRARGPGCAQRRFPRVTARGGAGVGPWGWQGGACADWQRGPYTRLRIPAARRGPRQPSRLPRGRAGWDLSRFGAARSRRRPPGFPAPPAGGFSRGRGRRDGGREELGTCHAHVHRVVSGCPSDHFPILLMNPLWRPLAPRRGAR